MEEQTPNIHVLHSVWRRIKKAKFHDLEPRKDAKGGGAVKSTVRPVISATRVEGKQE
jgi:hypothetical protein